MSEYSPVGPSGERLGKKITLKEILPYFRKSFLLKSPFIWLVGGLVTRGETEDDIDVLIHLPENISDAIKVPLEFRLYRALPEELRPRLQIIYDLYFGPFTNCIELADLKVEAREEPRLVEMNLDLDETEIEKLHLEEFRSEGVDEDILNARQRYRNLLADLRYLANAGYPRLKKGEKWGEWTLDDVLRYFGKIIDTLRGLYFPFIEKPESKSSWWQCYFEAKKKGYIKTKPPKEEELREWAAKRKELLSGKRTKKELLREISESLDSEWFPQEFKERAEQLIFQEITKAEFRATGEEGRKAMKEAKESIREDKIVLFRRFFPLKSSLSALMAYRTAEVYSVEQLIRYLRNLYKRGIR